MFSRRHPYLFFILIFTSIVFGSSVILSLILTASGPGYKAKSGESVGVVEVKGVISESEKILKNLKLFREDTSIKAIVLRVVTPGGGVGPSQEIYRAVKKTQEVKPVIASMGSVAASGGYYVSAATQGIMANPGTVTGSIGVIMGYTNFQQILEKIGLVPVVIKSGQYKDMGSPARVMKEEERSILQGFVDKIHHQFVRDVAEGRNLPLETVKKLADGRIYTGEEAKEKGLIDRLGNIEDAIDWAGELGGITGRINVVYPPEPKMNLLDYLTQSASTQIRNALFNSSVNAGYLYSPGNSQ